MAGEEGVAIWPIWGRVGEEGVGIGPIYWVGLGSRETGSLESQWGRARTLALESQS